MNNEIATVKPAYLSNLNPLDNECPVGMEDIKIPSIVLAQPASKAMVETDPGYIDGLRPGQFYNSVTREVYGKSVKVQFVHYFKTYQVFKGEEWQEALPEAEFKKLRNVQFDKKNGFLTPDKPDCFIRENWRIVLMLPEYNSFDFVFLNVKPGGIGVAKQWVNQMFAKFQNGEPINAIVWEINSYLKPIRPPGHSHLEPCPFYRHTVLFNAMPVMERISCERAKPSPVLIRILLLNFCKNA